MSSSSNQVDVIEEAPKYYTPRKLFRRGVSGTIRDPRYYEASFKYLKNRANVPYKDREDVASRGTGRSSKTAKYLPSGPAFEFSYAKKLGKTNDASTVKSFQTSYGKMVHPASKMLVDQIINPEGSSALERWPNTIGLSAMYKCKNVIDAKYDANKRSCIAVYPRLSNAIFTTHGAAVTGVVINPIGSGDNPYGLFDVSLDVNTTQNIVCPIYFGPNLAVLPCPNSDVGLMLYAVASTSSASRVINIQGTNCSAFGNFSITITRYSSALTVLSSTQTDSSSSGLVSITFNNSGSASYFSLEVNTGLLPYEGTLTISMHDPNAGTVDLPNLAQLCDVINIKDFFISLENSQFLEDIARNNNFDLIQVKLKLIDFRKFAELEYPNYSKFANHFKNWIIKNPPKDPNAPLKMVY